MKLRDYYAGQRVTLWSPLHPDEIDRRIKEETRCRWWERPFRSGPVGGIRFGRLKLRYVSTVFEYNAKPVLTGSLDRTAAGTILRLVYRGPLWSRIFYAAWYLFLALFSILLLVVGTDPPLQGAERALPFGVIALFVVFPIVLHAFGTARSAQELDELVGFLKRVADARSESPSG